MQVKNSSANTVENRSKVLVPIYIAVKVVEGCEKQNYLCQDSALKM